MGKDSSNATYVAFASPPGLLHHKGMLSGERRFKCNGCDKGFRYCSRLIEHRRIHSGERPLQCRECGKASNAQFRRNSQNIYKRIMPNVV